LAQRLFPNGSPILAKAQWIGFNGQCLILTVDYPFENDTLLKMAIRCPFATWLAPAKLWPMSKGFKSYIPGTILKPESAEAAKIETTGVFTRYSGLFFLKILILDGEVLLGRKGLQCNSKSATE
jgi:hypothetical protein